VADALRKGARVTAARDLSDEVPEGTKGRVMLSNGMDWRRYRVRFENGVEIPWLEESDVEAEPSGPLSFLRR
jgi:hypothetical protein